MRELNGCFSRWSNSRTGRTGTGHVWKNRFRLLDVVREGHFWSLVRYVPLNPVVADLTPMPDDWPWSGFRATAGIDYPYRFHRPAELLRYFEARPDAALSSYRAFVDERLIQNDDLRWLDED
jgi:putative transposase